jgi:hypothetical protein
VVNVQRSRENTSAECRFTVDLGVASVALLYVADAGSAVVAEDGRVFTGTCIGGPLGVCAELSALSAMVSKAGPVIRAIVAVWSSEDPPGGWR